MKYNYLIVILVTICTSITGQCADWLWAKSCGGTSDAIVDFWNDLDTGFEYINYNFGEHGSDLALDNNGSIYTTGYFSGTATFGSIVLSSLGYLDIFIAKMDNSGNYLWVKQLELINEYSYAIYSGSIESADLYDNPQIAVDVYGNVLVSGSLNDINSNNMVFGSTVLQGPGSFICKLDTYGNYIWAKKMATDYYPQGIRSITTDANGDIYMTGGFTGSQTFGTTLLQAAGGSDLFIVKMDISGNVVWARNYGGSGYECGISISLDNVGNTFVVGEFEGSATFGTITLNPIGYHDVFICKINAEGVVIWAKNAGTMYYDYPKVIKVDSNGDAYVLFGRFQNLTYYYDDIPISGGLIKVNTSGILLWSKSHIAEDLTIASDGDIFTVGFGGDWPTNGMGIISKWTMDGTLVTSSSVQGGYRGLISGVATDNNGACYVISLNQQRYDYFSNEYPVYFSNIEIVPHGFTNIVVAKYRASADHVQRVVTILNEPLPDVTNPSLIPVSGYQLRAWITSRPQDVLSSSTQLPSVIRLFKYGNGTTIPYETRTYLKLGAFNTQWTAGEVIHYEVTNLTQSTLASWEVVIPGGYPAEWVMADPIQLDLFPDIALPAPDLSIDTDEAGGIMLSWPACTGASSYNIYSSDDPSGTYSLLATISSLSYTHTDIGNTQTKMFYKVIAQSGRAESAPSNVVGYVKYDCVPGLNMIALPLEIPWEWVHELGSEYSSSIESIYYWNTAAQTWVGSTDLGECWDGDFAIHTNDALFISNTSAMSLFVCGRLPAMPTQFSLVAGINAIVIPLSIPQLTMASDMGIYLESIDSVYQWDNITQAYNVAYDLGGFWDMDYAIETGFPLLVNSLYALSWPTRSSDTVMQKLDK